ncbi:MAG TPA: gliding motility-associated C-terminal domain-containing protein, partial [Flavobacteriales bacterium]|nr:gliding motility-associated C-terminal domain-containing protein [Flavobacteriales bacterium]
MAAGWLAGLQCLNGCPEPTASFPPFPESPYKVCPYDTLALDGSGSTALPGRTLVNYAWSIAGTTTFSSTPQVQLPTPVPGQFPISLQVVDDIGCISTNSSAELVRVSTYPNFTGTGITPTTICNGESATLNGHAVGRLWSSVPQPIQSGLVALPDAQGGITSTYTGYLNVSGFPAGTTISNASDIIDVCFVMEHSYIGDLDITLVCPDGQVVQLFNTNAGGGGGTYLGGADDTGTGVPGVGAQYCFSTVAPFGTLAAENQAGNWVQAGNPVNNSMTPGTYTSEDPFTNFIGCNLNGSWTVNISDHLGIDDGYIFSFWMDIAPYLYPNVIEYTPTIGQDADSSFWSGNFITSTSPNADVATVTPEGAGVHAYTYTVTDNFGCTFDTTFNLTVTPGAVFEATAGPPCISPVQMGVHFELPIPVGALVYQWTPATSLSNAAVAFPTATPSVDTWYHLHVYPTGHPLCGIVDSVFVPRISNLVNDSVITDVVCFGEANGTVTVNTVGTGGPWNYEWTDAYGNVVQTTVGSAGDVFQGPIGTYQVHVTEGPNGTGCVDSLSATINEPPLLEFTGITADTTICLTGMAHVEAMAQGGTAPIVLNWDQGLSGNGPFSVSPPLNTTYAVFVTDAHNCITPTLDMTVNVRDALGFTLPDTLTICPGVDTTLTATIPVGGDSSYFFDWGAGAQVDPWRPVNLYSSQDLCVTLSDGCETPPVQLCTYWVVKGVPPLLLSVDTTLGCAPFQVHFAIEDTTFGAVVDWDFGASAPQLAAPVERNFTYTQSGHFTVEATVHWPNFCVVDTVLPELVIVEPIPTADFNWTPNPASILDPTLHFVPETGPYATDWRWTSPGLDTVNAQVATYTFPGQIGGLYPVTLRTANYLGCADSITKAVEVHGEFLVYTPNAFSPDGDGINDLFFVRGNDIATNNFELSVFDRWGHRLFSTTDPYEPWDGTSKGTALPQGMYVWKIK